MTHNVLSLVPRTRSSRTSCGICDRELRVQRGTRVIELLVVLRFRSSYLNLPRVLTNFGIGPLAAVAAFLLAILAAPAAAQDYPSRPITLIVPYAAGGGNDLMARTAAEKMSKTLGQQIVIENRGGAGGSIATRQIAKAEPDGYTLGLGGTGTLAINPTLYANVGYDPRRDFAPIGLIATSALVVCVHPSLPVRSIPDLIALANKEPGKLNYASAGTGSGIHLGTEYFATMAGIKLTHIPYKGSSPALTDLIGGHVAIYFSSLPPAVGLVKEGKVRALAVTSAKRSPIFPDLPTVAESALPGYEAVLHYGIVAPAGTPRPIIDKLSTALRAAVMSEDLKSRLADDGAEPQPSTPEEYAADIDREETKWSAIIKASGAKAE
jgi:tripartite-type tricarboxylate transporter receptor subunit TctC